LLKESTLLPHAVRISFNISDSSPSPVESTSPIPSVEESIPSSSSYSSDTRPLPPPPSPSHRSSARVRGLPPPVSDLDFDHLSTRLRTIRLAPRPSMATAPSVHDWDEFPLQSRVALDKELALATRDREDDVKSDVSGASIRSQIRRQEIEDRRRARAEEEDLLRREEEEELRRADEKSTRDGDAQSSRNPIRPRSEAEVKDETLSIAQRRLLAIDEERAALARAIAMLKLGNPVPSAHSALPSGGRRIGAVSAKVKATPPRPWKGVFNFSEQNSWIRTATGYLVSVGLQVEDYLDPSSLAFHIVRDLMWSEAPSGSGGISPQRWFDLRHDRKPWECAADVFAEIRRHWVDPRAAERSVVQFRAAKQGTMRASEFGALVASLAASCFTRHFGDADQQEVFLAGLVPDTRTYVELQVRQRVRDSRPTDFQTLVDIAADRDAIAPLASSSVSSASKKLSPPFSSPPSTSSSSPSSKVMLSSSSPPTRSWVDRAVEWQARHPIETKGEWFKRADSPAPVNLRCFGCARTGHYSYECSAPRVTPSTKLLVAAYKLSPSPLVAIPEASEEAGKDGGK
jgi:hypothetical protein